MGCSNSDLRKITHQDIQVEERIIQAGENLLVFKKKKIDEVFTAIESISFDLDSQHLNDLCEIFKVSPDSPTGCFFSSWLTQRPAPKHHLKLLSILVSDADAAAKLPLITSSDKDKFLETIALLVRFSFEVIPQNLQNIDTSSLLYADGLKQPAQEFLMQLSALEVPEIQKTFEETEVSSKEIRYKLMLESKKTRNLQKNDLKHDFFLFSQPEEPPGTSELVLEDKDRELSKKENRSEVKILENHENFELVNDEKTQENDSLGKKNADETGIDLKSFLEKIPNENHVDFTFSEESRSVAINEDSLGASSKQELKKPENPKETISSSDSPVKSPEPPDEAPRRLSVIDLYIQKCKETKKTLESEKNDSKIPSRSKTLSKIKSVTAISRPDPKAKLDAEDLKVTQIKSPKSSLLPPSKLLSPRDLERPTSTRGDLNLAESELLRRPSKKSELKSALEGKTEEKQFLSALEEKHKPDDLKHEEIKESKIGSIKEKVLPDDHDSKSGLARRNSKIGTLKNKK